MNVATISEFAELGLSKNNARLLDFSVKSAKDFDLFVDEFWTGTAKQMWSIQAFRKYKMEQNRPSFEQFEEDFRNNSLLALEQLFMEPLCKKDVVLVSEKILSGELTLEKLYNLNAESPYTFLMVLIR